VCLPYAGGHESEQTIRCRLLADRGLIQIVEKDAVGARNVAAAVNRALASPPVADAGVDMSGAGRTAEVLLAALARA
jgi:predicted glycosyltransferase